MSRAASLVCPHQLHSPHVASLCLILCPAFMSCSGTASGHYLQLWSPSPSAICDLSGKGIEVASIISRCPGYHQIKRRQHVWSVQRADTLLQKQSEAWKSNSFSKLVLNTRTTGYSVSKMGQKREIVILLESQTCSKQPKLSGIKNEIRVLRLSLPQGMLVSLHFILYASTRYLPICTKYSSTYQKQHQRRI